MKKNLLPIILLILLAAIVYWSYPIIKERYFDTEKIEQQENIENIKEETIDKEADPQEKEQEKKEEILEDDLGEIIPGDQTTIYREVTRKDCTEGCSNFHTEEDKKYCRQFCGISPPSTESDGCSEKSGLEKDYCYKDLGIKNLDLRDCEKIKDRNIRESCTVRVTEKIIETTKPL